MKARHQWLALLSGGGAGIDWAPLSSVATAALAPLRAALLTSLGFAGAIIPQSPPPPRPPSPPPAPVPPPPSWAAAVGGLMQGVGALLRGR